jgi:hypothetical protein
VRPDAKLHEFRHLDTGLLQGQHDLAAVMGIVRDEIAEKRNSRPFLEARVFFHDAAQALFNAFAPGLKRLQEFRAGRNVLVVKRRHALQEFAADVAAPNFMQMAKYLCYIAALGGLAVLKQGDRLETFIGNVAKQREIDLIVRSPALQNAFNHA